MLSLLGCFACGIGEGGYYHSLIPPWMAVAPFLVAMGVGALVGIQAGKAECCRKFGKFIGGFIVVVSFLMLLCIAVCGFKAFTKGCPSYGSGKLPPGHPPIEESSK